MKTNFTYTKKHVQNWYLLFILLITATLPTFAQTTQTKHIVEVKNYVFVPDTLHVEVGDTVEWQNIEGNHNVNGMHHTYPSNPVQFGNDLGLYWTYSFVFTLAGTYNYQCDRHALDGMLGKIIVEEPTAIIENESAKVQMYPNPATGRVWIDTGNLDQHQLALSVYDVSGKKNSIDFNSLSGKIEFNVQNLPQGIYLVELTSPDYKSMLKLIRK